eukprot:IDg17819t1
MGDQTTSAVVGRGSVSIPILHPDKKGLNVLFTQDRIKICSSEVLIAQGSLIHRLFELDIDEKQTIKESACISNLQLWHERLCHVHPAGIYNMASKNIVDGITVNSKSVPSHVCEGCIMGKLSRTPISKRSSSSSDGLLDIVHTGVAQFPERSKGGAKYFVTYIDDKSKMITVVPIKSKSDCFHYFLKYKNRVETETGRKIRVLRSDGGGEYISTEFLTFLEEHGIQHQKTCAYTPQQNGVAERMNRTLKELVRAMLHHKAVGVEFWEKRSTLLHMSATA